MDTKHSGVSEQILSLPKGGGAIKSLGEKFRPDLHTGTGNFAIPLDLPEARDGFGPELSLSYSTGAGNGPFGLGWWIDIPNVVRKTSRGIPAYDDDRDTFILGGAEDLAEVGRTQSGSQRTVYYSPRAEGLFSRIEHITDGTTDYWKVTTRDGTKNVYGQHPDSLIFSQETGARRVFAWHLVESRDTKGNKIRYVYQRDPGPLPNDGPHDFNQVYISRIDYGNYVDDDTQDESFLLRIDFDYGEFDDREQGSPQNWGMRSDAFSSYRAGFEIRTARRCKRILIRSLHPDANAPSHLIWSYDLTYTQAPLSQVSLLREVQRRGYDLQKPGASVAAAHRNTNLYCKAFPPLLLEYSGFDLGKRDIETLNFECAHPPEKSLADPNYELVDLYGNGLPDILRTTDTGYYCWRNLGNGRFAAPRRLRSAPAGVTLDQDGVQFADLNGNGSVDLLVTEGSARGYYANEFVGEWGRFHALRQSPSFSLKNPNVRLLDLDGDGVTDVLATFEHHFLYVRNRSANDGHLEFTPPVAIAREHNAENWPDVYFAHPGNRVRLADMTGDGLQDFVLIHDGRIDYWPNLGHGRWARRVTLLNGPVLPGRYDPQRLLLADVNGDGLADLVYVAANSVHYWINQSGNRWSEEQRIACAPPVTDADSVRFADIHGTGTGGILWSSDWATDRRSNYRFLDFTGEEKPQLLVSVVNNLGAETNIQYTTSTEHYIHDFKNGTPWITSLPFPVNVVDRIDIVDRISHNRFVTRYAYHHGYYDGHEREFRGFGRVEQWDSEAYAALSKSDALQSATNVCETTHVPPMMTCTWFHTGAYLEGRGISRQFESEYYQEPGLTEAQLGAMLLEDTVLPNSLRQSGGVPVPYSLSRQEVREACRALTGAILRRELYAHDGTPEQARPYTVTETSYTIELLRAKARDQHAIFLVHPREMLDFHYERKHFDINGQFLPDPPVRHVMNFAVDDFGNILQSVDIAYGRRYDDPNPLLTNEDRGRQRQVSISFSENDYTNAIDEPHAYRAPLPCDARRYELLQVVPNAQQSGVTNLFGFDEMRGKIAAASDGLHDVRYEDLEGAGLQVGHPHRRLIEHKRTYYRKDSLAGALQLGKLQSLALPYESYQLALTPSIVARIFAGRVSEAMLSGEGGYVHSEGDANWWIPSGRVYYSPEPGHGPAQELAFAQKHYFLPHRERNPFGEHTILAYDKYGLLLLETEDAAGNKVTAGERRADGKIVNRNDYRVFEPALLTDPNGNRAEVAFDALGLVVGSALMGKLAENVGDSLIGFQKDLEEIEVQSHLQAPLQNADAILQEATSRIVYDLFAYHRTRHYSQPQPVLVYALARETHVSDLEPGQQTKAQHSFSYSDGFGREIQKKIQAEPEKLNGVRGPPRWVGSGWTVFNNKGKPVRQFEPFFSNTQKFEFVQASGVSPILLYDPAERVVATLHPNHTFEKAVFGPWRQESWDANDTCLQGDPRNDPHVGQFFVKLPSAEYMPSWHALRNDPAHAAAAAERWPDTKARTNENQAAKKASAHAGTPTVCYFDTLGRPFLTFADNGADGKYAIRNELDIEGNQRAVIDANDRVVMRHDYDMLGNSIHQVSMDAGERWTLHDVLRNMIRAWDSRGHNFRTEYDSLRRPVRRRVRGTDPIHSDPRTVNVDVLYEQLEYGEGKFGDAALNLRTRIYKQYDSAGIVTNECYDFRGNLKRGSRQLTKDPKSSADWSSNPQLAQQTFTSNTLYDALNRPVQMVAAYNAAATMVKTDVVQPRYNEANLLGAIDIWLKRVGEPDGLLDPETADVRAVKDIVYNAKGQCTRRDYGNGASTFYAYDPQTFRLAHMLTRRDPISFPGDCPEPRLAGWPGCEVQNLRYFYDPAGNITHIHDAAQQEVFLRDRRVEPSTEYTYDGIYRLIEATGREHLGQVGGSPIVHSYNDAPRAGIDWSANDGNAMKTYTESYIYDAVGNVVAMKHRGDVVSEPGWTRKYAYGEASLIEPAKPSNRLSTTTTNAGIPEQYSYDPHGNMLKMPHVQAMRWDFKDQLQMTRRQAVSNEDVEGMRHTGEPTYYVYDATGARIRKVTEFASGQMKDERIYLGNFEIFRAYKNNNTSVELERETLHIMDDEQRIALVETDTVNAAPAASTPLQLIRYQFSSHVGSASLELDDSAEPISYEEYTPYGSTSYQVVNKAIKAAAKRYRYTGLERDEESGLGFHGARYYAAWLARWSSSDPGALMDGPNTYYYAKNNSMRLFDRTGTQSFSPPSLEQVRNVADSVLTEIRRAAVRRPGFDVDHLVAVKKLYRDYGRALSADQWRTLFRSTPELYAHVSESLNRSKGARSFLEYLGSRNPNIGGASQTLVQHAQELTRRASYAFSQNVRGLAANNRLLSNVADIGRSLQYRVIQTTPAAAAYWAGSAGAVSIGLLRFLGWLGLGFTIHQTLESARQQAYAETAMKRAAHGSEYRDLVHKYFRLAVAERNRLGGPLYTQGDKNILAGATTYSIRQAAETIMRDPKHEMKGLLKDFLRDVGGGSRQK